MTRPYSMDLRRRAMSLIGKGQSVRDVAARLEISPSAVVKWSQRLRRTGSTKPAQIGGYRRAILSDHRDFVTARFEAVPELALRQLQSELSERGITVSYGAIWAFVHANGLSFKKNRGRKRAGPGGRRKAKSQMAKASSKH